MRRVPRGTSGWTGWGRMQRTNVGEGFPAASECAMMHSPPTIRNSVFATSCTTIHVIISLIAILSCLVVLLDLLLARLRPGWMALFLATTEITSVMASFSRFMDSHPPSDSAFYPWRFWLRRSTRFTSFSSRAAGARSMSSRPSPLSRSICLSQSFSRFKNAVPEDVGAHADGTPLCDRPREGTGFFPGAWLSRREALSRQSGVTRLRRKRDKFGLSKPSGQSGRLSRRAPRHRPLHRRPHLSGPFA